MRCRRCNERDAVVEAVVRVNKGEFKRGTLALCEDCAPGYAKLPGWTLRLVPHAR